MITDPWFIIWIIGIAVCLITWIMFNINDQEAEPFVIKYLSTISFISGIALLFAVSYMQHASALIYLRSCELLFQRLRQQLWKTPYFETGSTFAENIDNGTSPCSHQYFYRSINPCTRPLWISRCSRTGRQRWKGLCQKWCQSTCTDHVITTSKTKHSIMHTSRLTRYYKSSPCDLDIHN